MAKILLVEDDNNLREIYEARLQAEGYEIVSARDGEEALTVAMKERPDLIISDVMMPKISGFDMLDIIRSTEETKNSKVIMMTALSQAEDKERATKLGADRYLVKSQVTLEDVAKVAREVLEGDSATSSTKEDTPVATPAPDPNETMSPDTSTIQPAPATTNDEKTDDTSSSQTPAPAPEPPTQAQVTPTIDPVQAVTSATPTPSTPTPAPAPVSDPVTQQPPTDDQQQAVVASPTPASEDSANEPGSVESLVQSVTQEQDAIAAQIENFIDAKKTAPETTVEPSSTIPQTNDSSVKVEPTPTEEQTQEENPIEAQGISETPKKKVIQPINDVTASKSADLENLLKKEEEKDQMSQIAHELSAQKREVPSDIADELSAEEALREAQKAQQNAKETAPEIPTETSTQQVKITEDGNLQTTDTTSTEGLVNSTDDMAETTTVETTNTVPEPAPVSVAATDSQATPTSSSKIVQPVTPESAAEMPANAPQSASEQSPAVNNAAQEPAPAVQPVQPVTEVAPQQPVIPHTNGTSIDGITAQPLSAEQPSQIAQPTSQQPEQTNTQKPPGLDPNSIAL